MVFLTLAQNTKVNLQKSPARLTDAQHNALQRAAKRVYTTLGMKGLSQVTSSLLETRLTFRDQHCARTSEENICHNKPNIWYFFKRTI